MVFHYSDDELLNACARRIAEISEDVYALDETVREAIDNRDYDPATSEDDDDDYYYYHRIDRPGYLVGLRNNVANEDWNGALATLDDAYDPLFSELIASLRGEGHADNLYDRLFESLKFLAGARFATIWTPENRADIATAEFFTEVDRRLAEKLAARPDLLHQADPRFFEELMASIFASYGLDVFLTKRTRDGGRDIIAIGQYASAIVKYIVECKRYQRERKVGIDLVRQLYGVKASEKATKAILATTSGYTQDAVRFAQQHVWELQLLDYQDIVSMLQRYARRGRTPGSPP